jgi:hypothetical protein
MRALFQDRVYSSVSATVVHLQQVTMPADTSRRDLWFRFKKVASDIVVYAYNTHALAITNPAPATYTASKTITVSADEQTVTLTNNASVDPNITGMTIRGIFTSSLAGTDSVWHYTAAPDLIVCNDIVTLLKNMAGSGQALEDFDATLGIARGNPAPYAEQAVVPYPFIGIYSMPREYEGSQGSSDHVSYPIIARMLLCKIDPQNLMDIYQNAWALARQYQSALESILGDEYRILYQEEEYKVFSLVDLQPGEPSIQEDIPFALVADTVLRAEFTDMWRDDKNPRP